MCACRTSCGRWIAGTDRRLRPRAVLRNDAANNGPSGVSGKVAADPRGGREDRLAGGNPRHPLGRHSCVRAAGRHRQPKAEVHACTGASRIAGVSVPRMADQPRKTSQGPPPGQGFC